MGKGAGLVRGLPVALGVAQAGDLAANKGTVGDVQVCQRGRVCLRGELTVRGQEGGRQLGCTESFQVHRQEGDVAQDVADPQPPIELQAVEHARPVVEAENVAGQQVPVPVPHPSVMLAPGEQRCTPGEVPQRQAADLVHGLGGENLPSERGESGEPFFPESTDGRRAACLGDLRGGFAPAVEPRQLACERTQMPAHVVAAGNHGGQAPMLGHPPHHHHVVAELAVGSGHVGNPEVDVRGQTPVQLDLRLARRQPGPAGREVEEPEVHGFLHLVHAIPEKDHHRRVGLHECRRSRHIAGISIAVVSAAARDPHGCTGHMHQRPPLATVRPEPRKCRVVLCCAMKTRSCGLRDSTRRMPGQWVMLPVPSP